MKTTMTIICIGISTAIIAFTYYRIGLLSVWGAVAAPFLILLAAGAITFLWIVYFVVNGNRTVALSLGGLLFVVVILMLYMLREEIYRRYTHFQEQQKIEKVLSTLENKTYISEKLGISFNYLSGDTDGSGVTIREEGNSIYFSPEEKGVLTLYKKDPKISLIDTLKALYSESYPSCGLYPEGMIGDEQGLELDTPHLPSAYSFVILNPMYEESPGDHCPPVTPTTIDHTKLRRVVIMDSMHPDRYVAVSFEDRYGSYTLGAALASNPEISDVYFTTDTSEVRPKKLKKWFETILFYKNNVTD